MEKDAKIFVAGHKGMVGSAILRKLQDLGYNNFCLRNHNELDLISQEQTAEFFRKEKPDYVFDAAAKVGGILANNTARAQFIYENLSIQNNIIHHSYLTKVKKLVFLGSSCIYPKYAPQPMKEEHLLTGALETTNEPYAIAKIAGIKMCEAYHDQYGCEFISLMPTNLYGPNDNYDLETSHVLPALIRKMHLAKCLENHDWQAVEKDLMRRPVNGVNGNDKEKSLDVLRSLGLCTGEGGFVLELWGSGSPFREFLHVDDLAAASVFAMDNFKMPALQHRHSTPSFLNVGCGEEITIKQLAETIKKLVGFKGLIKWNTDKPDGTPRKLLDISRISQLGWKPEIGLEQGIMSVYYDYLKE